MKETNEKVAESEGKGGAMIRVEHLVKRYGGTAFALDDVSFEIGEGEIVGLLGPNGAGKSTAMNILTGYLSTTSGRAEIGGVDILENPLEAKRMIGTDTLTVLILNTGVTLHVGLTECQVDIEVLVRFLRRLGSVLGATGNCCNQCNCNE